MKLEDNQLPELKLSKLAKKVTKFRKIQRDRALAANCSIGNNEAEEYLRTTEKLARKMHNGYFSKPKEANICKHPYLTKRQRWRNFTLDDKVNMVHDVIIRKEKVVDVAKRYCRTQGFVSSFISKIKKNNGLLHQLIDKRDQSLMKQSVVQKVIKDLMAEDHFISSAQVIVDEVKSRIDIDVTTSYVMEQMHLLGLKYSKVKHISMQGNSAKSLVLRQRWALAFL